MYIELFIVDNLLMNLLIVRLAAALLSVRPPLYRQLAAGALSAAIAAIAAYLWPPLLGLWARPPLLLLMSLALPVRNLRGLLTAACATLFATLAVGGAVFCAELVFGAERVGAGIPLRVFLLGAFCASFLPRAARSAMKRRLPPGSCAGLTIRHRGIERSFAALVDTGCGLHEPLTGLPVIIVACSAYKVFAKLPVRAVTAGGECTLFAFRPEAVFVDGAPVACLAAVSLKKLSAEAIIPPELCGGLREKSICDRE